MNSAQDASAESQIAPAAPTEVPSSPAVNDADIEAHRQIEDEVQQLLSEMHTSFKSFSDDIFTKIDQMEAKINELDETLVSLSKSVEPSAQRAGASDALSASPPKQTAA